MRVLHTDRLPVQRARAGSAEGYSANARVTHQTGSSINALPVDQSLRQRARGPEGLMRHVRWHHGDSDVRRQHGVEQLEKALERPLAFFVERVDNLRPA